jgi:hypothetical protein
MTEMTSRILLMIIFILPNIVSALADEEKKRGCRELASKVLPVQRTLAFERCLEFATNECDRIERSFKDSCLESSHSDNAVRYDMDRGTARFCEAALVKRETHRTLCEGIRNECLNAKVAMGGAGTHATCTIFRDEDDKKLCVETSKQAARILAAEKSEKERCLAILAPPRLANPTTSHGVAEPTPAVKLPPPNKNR